MMKKNKLFLLLSNGFRDDKDLHCNIIFNTLPCPPTNNDTDISLFFNTGVEISPAAVINAPLLRPAALSVSS